MAVFQDIKIGWAGKSYIIPANRVLEAIARIEDHVTLVEITRHQQERSSIPLARLALAFHSVIVFAGAQKVTGEEVYRGMFMDGDAQKASFEAINTLLAMMVPPEMMAKAPTPGKSRRGVARSSRKRIKP